MGYDIKELPNGKYAIVKKSGKEAPKKADMSDLAKSAITDRLKREMK